MTHSLMSLVALYLLPIAVLMLLGYQDVVKRRLPNPLVGVYFLLFFPVWWLTDGSWHALLMHCAAAALVLIVLLPSFAFNWIGGGDVKLWAAVAFWAGLDLLVPTLIITTFTGVFMGLVGVVARCLTRHSRLRLWRYLSLDRGIPYGVGLALSGLFVLYRMMPAV